MSEMHTYTAYKEQTYPFGRWEVEIGSKAGKLTVLVNFGGKSHSEWLIIGRDPIIGRIPHHAAKWSWVILVHNALQDGRRRGIQLLDDTFQRVPQRRLLSDSGTSRSRCRSVGPVAGRERSGKGIIASVVCWARR